MSYVYVRSEAQLWTVGFYMPDGRWETDSDHDIREDAANRVAWLNGSGHPKATEPDGLLVEDLKGGDAILLDGEVFAIITTERAAAPRDHLFIVTGHFPGGTIHPRELVVGEVYRVRRS